MCPIFYSDFTTDTYFRTSSLQCCLAMLDEILLTPES